ncbi:MAG: hypothetical protein ACRDDY_17590 [Clostridium sp.]|uniref:hypothetical protein n=1 Tax=Clostridium sp. TaxID=1506 RepID=UPI003EE58B20
MKVGKVLGIIGIIVLIILIIIPRSYFVKKEVVNSQTEKVALTNGPKEVNEFVSNIIEVQAISGDMGNTIEYTLKDIITQNEASQVLAADFNDLEEIKGKIISLGNEYPEELGKEANVAVQNINKLENITKETLPYIQNYNAEKLQSLSSEISYCFNYNVDKIGRYTVNQGAYNNELADMTYKYNNAKQYVS